MLTLYHDFYWMLPKRGDVEIIFEQQDIVHCLCCSAGGLFLLGRKALAPTEQLVLSAFIFVG